MCIFGFSAFHKVSYLALPEDWNSCDIVTLFVLQSHAE